MSGDNRNEFSGDKTEQRTSEKWSSAPSEKVEKVKKSVGIKGKPVSPREDNRAIHSQRITEAHGKEIQPVALNDEHLLWMELAQASLCLGALIATDKRIVFAPFLVASVSHNFRCEDIWSAEWQQIREVAPWNPRMLGVHADFARTSIRVILQEGTKENYFVITKDGEKHMKGGKRWKYSSTYHFEVAKKLEQIRQQATSP